MGLSDLDVSTKFDYEQAFMEATLLISASAQENISDHFKADTGSSRPSGESQLILPLQVAPGPSHPNVDTTTSIQVGNSTGLSSLVLLSTSELLSLTTPTIS